MPAPPQKPGAIDEEMRRRFEAAERIRVHRTALLRPALAPTEDHLVAHFSSPIARAERPLENAHHEPSVSSQTRAEATPAAVLLAVVLRESGPTLLVTRRHEGISYPGHWVFPGGRADETDASPTETALREAEEEIGLPRSDVQVLGRLGEYVSHSGFRIVPTVGLVRTPVRFDPNPHEVEAIAELPLSQVFDCSNYFLYRFQGRPDRAHFALEAERYGVLLTGVTVSIAIGWYRQLLETQPIGAAGSDPPRRA